MICMRYKLVGVVVLVIHGLIPLQNINLYTFSCSQFHCSLVVGAVETQQWCSVPMTSPVVYHCVVAR